MKSRETLIRLLRFEVDDKRQKVSDIEMMIADFERMASDLERQIEVEQQRAGVSDINHFAYPTFAKAALQRRDNLQASVGDFEEKLAKAQDELAEAFEELKKAELVEERDVAQERKKREAAAQNELDEAAITAHMQMANHGA